jgi:hypothetical protein
MESRRGANPIDRTSQRRGKAGQEQEPAKSKQSRAIDVPGPRQVMQRIISEASRDGPTRAHFGVLRIVTHLLAPEIDVAAVSFAAQATHSGITVCQVSRLGNRVPNRLFY